MVNASEANDSNVYIEKLLAALKQLQDFADVEGVVQQAINATKTLQTGIRENVLDKVPKNFDDVIGALQVLRESLESLGDETRGQAIQLFATAQEACLNLSRSVQVGANSKFQTLKASALDAAAAIDVETCIASLKNMQNQLVSEENQQRLQGLVGAALEQTNSLRDHLTENCHTYFQDTVIAISKIRESLVELSIERKESLLEAYATCQEALLSLTSRMRFGETLSSFKDQALDAAAHLDVENAVAALKGLGEEVKTMDKEKLTNAVAVAYEKATQLQKSLQEGVTDKASKYYEEVLSSLHQVHVSLQDTASEKKAAALLMYTKAQDSFVNLAQKIRATEGGSILFSMKNRALDTAVFLDDRYSLWQKVQVYAEAALLKGKVVLENERVVGAIDAARALDDKIAQGTVNSVVGKGYGIVEAGAAYLKDEVQAARQRQQDGGVAQAQ